MGQDRTASTTTTATARSATSPPSSASPGRPAASPAGSGTTTTTAGSTSSSTTIGASARRGRGQSPGRADRGAEPPPALPQPRPRRVPRRHRARSASTGPWRRWARTSATSTTTASSTSTSAPGRMSYSGLVPNLMFKNVDGRDASRTSPPPRAPATSRRGTASRSPTGTATATSTCSSSSAGRRPATRRTTLLFQNPGHGRHWLKVKLVGTRTNRAALGARIRVDLKAPDGQTRSIYRTVGNNSSFGGNSLVETIGLRRRDARRRADGLLADEPDDPDLPRPRRRPGDRDHRGFRHLRSSSTSRG